MINKYKCIYTVELYQYGTHIYSHAFLDSSSARLEILVLSAKRQLRRDWHLVMQPHVQVVIVPSIALREYRRQLLGNATYNLSEVPPLPLLPILHANNSEAWPEWHSYVRRLRGPSLPFPIDLNTWTWFYWDAPLRVSRMLLCDWHDVASDRVAPPGTPWMGGLDAWQWGPEHMVRKRGFFVSRPSPFMTIDQVSNDGPMQPEHSHGAQAAMRAKCAQQRISRLEVMRIGPIQRPGFDELEQLWLYHAIGSGIFVRTDIFRQLDLRVYRHMSVQPRVELVGKAPSIQASATPKLSKDLGRTPSAGSSFWPSWLHFELYDGTACYSDSQQARILSCTNLPRLSFEPAEDPVPEHAVRHTAANLVREERKKDVKMAEASTGRPRSKLSCKIKRMSGSLPHA